MAKEKLQVIIPEPEKLYGYTAIMLALFTDPTLEEMQIQVFMLNNLIYFPSPKERSITLPVYQYRNPEWSFVLNGGAVARVEAKLDVSFSIEAGANAVMRTTIILDDMYIESDLEADLAEQPTRLASILEQAGYNVTITYPQFTPHEETDLGEDEKTGVTVFMLGSTTKTGDIVKLTIVDQAQLISAELRLDTRRGSRGDVWDDIDIGQIPLTVNLSNNQERFNAGLYEFGMLLTEVVNAFNQSANVTTPDGELVFDWNE